MSKHCTACGKEIGGGQMGMASHWNAHRRLFFKYFQRMPYDNVELKVWMRQDKINVDDGEGQESRIR